jgi:hypothetical protein
MEREDWACDIAGRRAKRQSIKEAARINIGYDEVNKSIGSARGKK